MISTKSLFSFIAIGVFALTADRALAMCGDVTGDGHVTSSDALSVLREAVGDDHTMMCDVCPGGTTTTTVEGATTTTLAGGASYTLHVSSNGMMSGGMMDNGHGTVTSEPAGISCGNDCSEDFAAGQDVTLTAVADSDSDFVGWMGDVPVQCMYNDDPCTVEMTHDRTVWAVFVDHNYGGGSTTTLGGGPTTTVPASGTYTLHVAVNGMMSGGMMDNGHGTVTSAPAGVSCGNDCSEDFEAGQAVTLTAVAESGSDFIGWMGDVPYQCMYNDDPCTVTITRDRSVWAVFLDDNGGMGGGMH